MILFNLSYNIFYHSINPKILISSLRYLAGSYSHFNIYIANFTMYSLKCHTEDVRGVREDVGRKERILYSFLIEIEQFPWLFIRGFITAILKAHRAILILIE